MPEGPISAEEVAHRGFPTSFRGFDPNEVRSYLGRVADELRAAAERERELHRRMADAEHRAAHPVLDQTTLMRALGDETARVLASAQEAAQELRVRAEDNVARILKEAHEEAQRIRGQAELVLGHRREEAEAAAAEIQRVAEAEASAVLERARREAEAALAQVDAQARELVQEAQQARARVLGDLARRRRIAHLQVEQLRAGRERLLDAYRVVRRTLDEVSDELQRAEAEARQAAEAVTRRLASEPNADVDELEAALSVPPLPASTATAEVAGSPAPAAQAEVQSEPAVAEPEPAERASDLAPMAAEDAVQPSAVRILRRQPPEDPPVELDVVEAPASDEAVRVIAPEAEGEQHSDAQMEAAEVEAAEVAAESDDTKASVDDLFARIRADRAEAVSRAREVLSEPDRTPEVEPVVVDADEHLLQQRDAALEGVEAKLARRLKRALQDEQNDVLDRQRSLPGKPDVRTLLLSEEEQQERYRVVGAELLSEAARAGASFVGTEAGGAAGGDGTDLHDLADELARSLVEPLRRRLTEGVERSVDDDETTGLVDRIGAAYREWKTQRIERLAGDSVVAAFSRGTLAAVGAGAKLRWLVDDGGDPCPDCDDNALAGTVPAGDAYPTGQTHPPAHAGCRCLLVSAQ